MKKLVVVFLVVWSLVSIHSYAAIVLDFDDLSAGTVVSGSGYAGLTWELGNAGYDGNPGQWILDSEPDYPNSNPNNIINSWGCTLIGIQFPENVNVLGAYFAAQGDVAVWTTGIRVHGFLDGSQTGLTGWFNDIDEQPDWFGINLMNVDRIVIESVPTYNGGGWYGMDDFTYEVVPEPATLGLLGLISIGLYFKRRFFIA